MGCKGLYADVNFVKSTIGNASKDIDVLKSLINAYTIYKRHQIRSTVLTYDKDRPVQEEFKIASKPYHPLRVVQIYFDTATYDKNVKDVSVTLADQLGAIGGTMGLFSGFSFLSALEILYFLMKALLSAAKKRFSQT